MSVSRRKPEPERHVWFDDWRGIQGEALLRLKAEIVAGVDAAEVAGGHRQRKRRPVDQANHELAVEVVVANLAYAALNPPPTGRLAILTGNGRVGATRYDNTALGKPLRSLLYRLDEAGVLTLRGSSQRLEASSIAPSEAFARRVSEAGASLSDFGRIKGEETIVLKRKRKQAGSDTGTRKLVDYAETNETMGMRRQVDALNDFVAVADIAFIDDGQGRIDVFDRFQRRQFSTVAHDSDEPAFHLTGRLFGGFWQTLKSARRSNIRIDGEPVAVLDYSSLYPRLAYAHTGAVPPAGDIYAIDGLTGHRKSVKKALNCLMMDDFHRSRWPTEFTSGSADEDDDPSVLLPSGWGVKRFKQALHRRYPALAPCLGKGLGLQLMHTESEILLRVLEELQALDIIGLGLHDGLLAPTSKAGHVKEVMEAVARDITSADLPVTIS